MCGDVFVRHRRGSRDNIKMEFRMWDGTAWTGFIWLRTGIVGVHLKSGKEPSESIQ